MKWIWISLALVSPAIAGPVEPQQYLIERIDVRNLRFASPEIIRAELRMPTGREYTGKQIREASDRINRLPFVLDNQYSLEKGSTDDAWVLVIAVTETWPAFLSLNADAAFYHLDNVWNDLKATHAESGTLGARIFVGRHDAVDVALSRQRFVFGNLPNTYEAGYTRYGLFGSGAFARLSVMAEFTGPYHQVQPGVLVGVPLGAKSTLTVDFAATRDVRENGPIEFTSHTQMLHSTFAYDTTNSPFFPTRGVILSISPTVTWERVRLKHEDFGLQFELALVIENLALRAARYWPLNDTNSVSTLVAADITKFAPTENVSPDDHRTGKFDIGFLHSFRRGKTRAEMGLELHVAVSTFRFEDGAFVDHETRTSATASFVRRNAWGSLRIGATYQRPPEVGQSPPATLP